MDQPSIPRAIQARSWVPRHFVLTSTDADSLRSMASTVGNGGERSPIRHTASTESHGSYISSTSTAHISRNQDSLQGTIGAPAVHHFASIPELSVPDLESNAFNDSPLPHQVLVHDAQSVVKFFRWKIFATYQRLFSLVTLINVAILVWFVIRFRDPTLENCALIATPISANLFLAILFRTEDWVNLLFASVVWVPRTLPLFFRKELAHVYEFGGVHSGSAAAATLWALVFAIQATRVYVSSHEISVAVLTIAFAIFTLTIFIIGAAQPSFRRYQHNMFECVHRFCGWTSLILFWALTILLANNIARKHSQPLAMALFTNPPIYFLILATCLVILPWLRLRRITIHAATPSAHLTRLYFPYPAPRPNAVVRLSTAPLKEWHTFATIPPSPVSSTSDDPSLFSHAYSVLVSNAGDWTRSQIEHESHTRTYWVRGIPTVGVPHIARLFSRVVLVGTGSGIGPVLSAAWACRKMQIAFHIIWSTQAPKFTYSEQVVKEVYDADPKAVVWDTRARGRPNLVALAWRRWKDSEAEAVIVVSNPKVTGDTVFGLEMLGVAAYGPIFDS